MTSVDLSDAAIAETCQAVQNGAKEWMVLSYSGRIAVTVSASGDGLEGMRGALEGPVQFGYVRHTDKYVVVVFVHDDAPDLKKRRVPGHKGQLVEVLKSYHGVLSISAADQLTTEALAKALEEGVDKEAAGAAGSAEKPTAASTSSANDDDSGSSISAILSAKTRARMMRHGGTAGVDGITTTTSTTTTTTTVTPAVQETESLSDRISARTERRRNRDSDSAKLAATEPAAESKPPPEEVKAPEEAPVAAEPAPVVTKHAEPEPEVKAEPEKPTAEVSSSSSEKAEEPEIELETAQSRRQRAQARHQQHKENEKENDLTSAVESVASVIAEAEPEKKDPAVAAAAPAADESSSESFSSRQERRQREREERRKRREEEERTLSTTADEEGSKPVVVEATTKTTTVETTRGTVVEKVDTVVETSERGAVKTTVKEVTTKVSSPIRETDDLDVALHKLTEEELAALLEEEGINVVPDVVKAAPSLGKFVGDAVVTHVYRSAEETMNAAEKARGELEEMIAKVEANSREIARIHLNGSEFLTPELQIRLGRALATNTETIEVLLAFCNIGNDGSIAIAEGMKSNKSITSLNLESNNIGAPGIEAMADMLMVNATLTELRLTNQRGTIGAKAEGKFARAMEQNTTIQKLNFQLKDINFREKVDKFIFRNKDLARQRRNMAKKK